MKTLRRWFVRVADALIARTQRRVPDFVIGGAADPYLLRWWLIPRNRFFNVYLHKFLRDDDDRALHDHPWFWCSIILRGAYLEHSTAAGGVRKVRGLTRGSVRVHGPRFAHRLALVAGIPCWTLFVTGPRLRNWGFHCPERGWVPWQQFTAQDDPGAIGPGCGES